MPYPVPSLETNSGNTVSIVAAWVDDNDRVLIFSSFATASRWLSELVATRAIGVIAEEIAEDTFLFQGAYYNMHRYNFLRRFQT